MDFWKYSYSIIEYNIPSSWVKMLLLCFTYKMDINGNFCFLDYSDNSSRCYWHSPCLKARGFLVHRVSVSWCAFPSALQRRGVAPQPSRIAPTKLEGVSPQAYVPVCPTVLSPFCRIFIAALTSRSSTYPHWQTWVRVERDFWTLTPQWEQIWLV